MKFFDLQLNSKMWLLYLGLIASPMALKAMEINDFVADSISAHPEILEQVHVFRQDDQDRDIADSGWLPSVDLSASAGTYETESPSIGPVKREYESTRAELSLTQNLFNGFDTEYQQQQTKARASSALYEIFDTADNIALQAVQLYLNLLKQQELVKLAEVNVSSHERILAQIRERNESGVGRQSELQQTEGRVARAHAGLIAQQNNLQDAASQLHEMIGRNVTLTELKLPETPDLSELPLEELTDIALEKHPAIRVANYNIQAALSDSSRARYNNYPRVDLRLAKEVGDDLNGLAGDTDQLSLVLNLTYNLYRGGADKAAERKKISAVHQSQEFSSRVRRQAINTLRLSWVADQSLTSQLRYLNTHIVKAKETVASYGEEFFIGQRDLVDLLDAESELNTANNQYAEAYYDSIAARYRVLEAMGELFPALSLHIDVGEDDLKISKVRQKGGDTQQQIQVVTNTAPVLGEDELHMEMNSVLVIPQSVLIENDTDADNDILQLVEFTQPDHGVLAFDDNKNIVYRADDDFMGTDSFSYTVTDGQGAVASASVYLMVEEKSGDQLTKTQFVNFIYKSTKLTPASESNVEDIVSMIKNLPDVGIEVYCYTDNIASESYNQALSKRRAIAVHELLIANGIDGNRIKIFGKGEKDPIADNSTDEGRAINRRGEIQFIFDKPVIRLAEKPSDSVSDAVVEATSPKDTANSELAIPVGADESMVMAAGQFDHARVHAESREKALSDEDILILQVQAKGKDRLPLDPDRDVDKEEEDSDHCDNSVKEITIDSFGCHEPLKIDFGFDSLNAIPIVGDDELHVEMNSVLVITQSVLMENDIDADNDTLRLVDFTQPAHGNLAFDDQKNIIYRAADGFTGTDGFTYTVSDGQGAVVSAYVKLVVEPKSEMRLTKTQFVNFIYKSSKLTPASSAKVESIVEMIKNLPGIGIEIYCYTDNIANESYNQALSDRRAKATRDLLLSFDIDVSRIKAFGMGEKNPIADNSTEQGRAINRRGEIQFIFGAPAGTENVLLPAKLN